MTLAASTLTLFGAPDHGLARAGRDPRSSGARLPRRPGRRARGHGGEPARAVSSAHGADHRDIHFPLLGEVPVADLPVADVGRASRPSWPGRGGAPARVRVREFHSRSVFVGGEVTRPGRKALKAGGRLIDTLVDAGGFSAAASGEVLGEPRDGLRRRHHHATATGSSQGTPRRGPAEPGRSSFSRATSSPPGLASISSSPARWSGPADTFWTTA